MTRKTQLEKFNARMGKIYKDEEVIKKTEINESTVEKQAGKVANKFGVSTEDIFAIITRDSIGSFMQMWNNGLQNAVRETLRTETKQIIREVVQEELTGAYRGIMKGMFNIEDIVKEEIQETVAETIGQAANMVKESKIENKIVEVTDKFINVKASKELNDLIILSSNDIDPSKTTEFKRYSGRANGLYQRFIKNNPGQKGLWAKYAQYILKNNKE